VARPKPPLTETVTLDSHSMLEVDKAYSDFDPPEAELRMESTREQAALGRRSATLGDAYKYKL